MTLRSAKLPILFLPLLAASAPAAATQVFGTDIIIEDWTPALIFDDTSVADGQPEWILRGLDEGFSLASFLNNSAYLSVLSDQRITTIGKDASAPSNQGWAIGSGASAQDQNAGAIGRGAMSTSVEAIAIGAQSVATGNGYAVGFNATHPGAGSVTVGANSLAQESNSVALGANASTNGIWDTAIGFDTGTRGWYGVAIGAHAYSFQRFTFVLGSIEAQNDQEYHDVGMGTSAPLSPLHVYRDDATQEFLTLQSAQVAPSQDRAMMDLANNGGIRFEFRDKNQPTGWRFQAQTGAEDRFEITKVGTGEIEYSFHPNGNLYVAGSVFTNSDVNAKRDLVPVDGGEILARLAELPIAEWSYRDASPQRHLGPMAQDFHALFGLGEETTSLAATDLAGVSLSALQALQQRNAYLEQNNRELLARDRELDLQIVALERHVRALMDSPHDPE